MLRKNGNKLNKDLTCDCVNLGHEIKKVGNHMFEIKNVSRNYNEEFALQNVSLRISKGLNFIIGPSGSGKTTLLKIISAMEQEYDGEVLYCGKRLKNLSVNEQAYFYNNIFGFVWQDFNLLEDCTVWENVILPQYIKNNQNQNQAEKILKELAIYSIAQQKVKYLSGGQKQRVAIARELMKNPQVIIADEPSSALDEKTAKATMAILRDLAKHRTVIVVTHDTSLITKTDLVFELDKGELISQPNMQTNKTTKVQLQGNHKLSFKNACKIARTNMKHKAGRYILSILSLICASVLLLTSVSGSISNNSQGEFDKLFKTYGDSLTDISVINSFTDATGTDNKANNKPSGDVSQDISGLYSAYENDPRVSFIAYLQAFDDINIKVDGKSYTIESSGNAPSINKLVAGKMPAGEAFEVVVPDSFVKRMNLTPEQSLGKELDFNGTIVDWSSGSPQWKKTGTKAKIVGVMDATVFYEYESKVEKFNLEDSFFFNEAALAEMMKGVGKNVNTLNFLIRAKTPEDMIMIKDELSSKGIVPLGRFELVEDMVRLNNQTTQQSGSASIMIGGLSFVMVIAIFLITGILRKKEIAIYKVSGFTKHHIYQVNLAEHLYIALLAIIFTLISSPLLTLFTNSLFGVNIFNIRMLSVGTCLIVATSLIAYLTTVVTSSRVRIDTALKSGDR